MCACAVPSHLCPDGRGGKVPEDLREVENGETGSDFSIRGKVVSHREDVAGAGRAGLGMLKGSPE